MFKKKIINTEKIYNNIIDENLNEDAVAYVQKSNYITIIYENNTFLKKNYLDNYPIKLLTHKIYDKLKNILAEKEKNINVKYILFKNKSFDKFQNLINILNNSYNTNIDIDNYQVYYSLQKTIINPHYDRVDRYMIQVKGTKKILLLEPNFIKNFKEYPLLHPANRNFQIKSICENNKITNNIKEFNLNEGDCLFIPKYWIHEISTEDESMSLVFTLNNKDIEKIYYYEIGKEIDSGLFQLGGMDLVFEWNKLWLCYNDTDFTLSKKNQNIYSILTDYLISKFPNNIDLTNVKEEFHKHSKSYKIFFDNNINIPNY